MQFSGPLINVSNIQHHFAQTMVVQLTQLGLLHFIQYYYPLNIY